jgi:RimJ/RimL family protein N-acetyltransferase
LKSFQVLNADPRVMQYYPDVLNGEQSDALAERIQTRLREQDFGLWAVEVPGVADFIGFIGLSVPGFTSHFTPCVEIGWRLAFEHWGKGYASEGASAALGRAFVALNLKEVVSFTVPENRRSIGVMERIGMVRSPADDFDRPWRPGGYQRHVLYRIQRSDWLKRQL